MIKILSNSSFLVLFCWFLFCSRCAAGSNAHLDADLDSSFDSLTETEKDLMLRLCFIRTNSFDKDIVGFLYSNRDLSYELQKLKASNFVSESVDLSLQVNDRVVEFVLKRFSNQDVKSALREVILSFFNKIKIRMTEDFLMLVSKNSGMLDHMKYILNNCEKNGLPAEVMIPLRFYLFQYNVLQMDFVSSKRFADKFLEDDSKNNFVSSNMNPEQKVIYAAYLGYLGYYIQVVDANYDLAIQYFRKAYNFILKEGIDNYVLKKSTLHFLVQAQIHSGYTQEANANFQLLDSLMNQKEPGLYFLKAKICFELGLYEESLHNIDQCIDAANSESKKKKIPQYLLKIQILNALSRFKEAKYVIEIALLEEAPQNQLLFASIFVRSVPTLIGLGDYKKALEYAFFAKKIYVDKENIEAATSDNIKSGFAFLSFADALAVNERVEEALEYYLLAEGVFKRAYKDNFKNMYNISFLYLRSCKAACHQKSLFWFSLFQNRCIKNFGKSNYNCQAIFRLKNTCELLY